MLVVLYLCRSPKTQQNKHRWSFFIHIQTDMDILEFSG